jgi:hypothetical protein
MTSHARWRRSIWSLAPVAAPLLVALAAAPAAAQSLRSKGEFTDGVARQFEKANPGATVSVLGPLTLKLATPGRSPNTIALERIWRFCRANRENCPALVASFVEDLSAGQHEADQPIERRMLRVVVRSQQYIEAGNRPFGDDPQAALVARPLAGDLWMLCVADKPHTTTAIRLRDIAKLGLSSDEAMELGIKNLAGELPPLSKRWHGVPKRELGIIRGEGYYEASRILLHDDWATLAQEMKGHLIVAVPGTDDVFYANDEDPDAVAVLADTAAHFMPQQERPISATVLKWTPTGWEVVEAEK